MEDERYRKGVARRAKLFDHSTIVPRLEKISPALAEAIVSFAFGDIHDRPGLDLKTRELVIVAALAAQGGLEAELRSHIKAAHKSGATREELLEVMLQLAVYAGFPAAVNGTFLVGELIPEDAEPRG